MALETVTHISDLVATNPTSSDLKSQGDDHIRNIKTALKTDFPNVAGVVSASHTELSYVAGVTSAIQTQLNAKAALDSPALTGTPTAPTAAVGTSTTQVATTAFVAGTAFSSALPAQTGNAGKFVTTNGSVASWAYAGISTINATVTTSTTLSSTYLYVPVQMASLGQSITLPNATTASVGGPQYVIDNTKGGYPVGIRDNTGVLLMAVAAGGEALVSLKDNSTQAGVWSVTGSSLEPGLASIDNTFSSTYASSALMPFAALDSNTSIHFAPLSSGFAAFVVDNAGKVLTTPVTVDSGASAAPKAAFKVSATSAVVFYTNPSGSQSVVLTLSGSSPSYSLAVGTPAQLVASSAALAAENANSASRVAQLSSGLYLTSYTSGANTTVIAVSVSGATVTVGSAANIITANSVSNSTTTYPLTSTTALVLYKSGAAAPFANNAVVVSVSGTTCTVGTPASATGNASSSSGAAISCLLSATKALIVDENNTSGANAFASAITVSGTTVSIGSALTVESSISTAALTYLSDGATRNNPHLFPLSSSTALLWYLDSAGVSRAVILSESGGSVTAGTKLYKSISSAASNSAGYGIVLPQGLTEFVVLREHLASTAGFGLQIVPSKISGTTITVGAGVPMREVFQDTPANYNLGKLSSGDYILLGIGTAGVCGQVRAPVFRCNGDSINMRGFVSIPELSWSSVIPVAAPASNRFVIMGATAAGTSVGATTYQLRLLNLEIAQ